MPRQIGVGEGTEEEVGFLDAARRKSAGAAVGMVEPGERQGTQFGVNLGKDVVDGERVAISTDQKAVRTERLGLGIASATDAGIEALPLVASGELLTRGDALGIVWGRVEVKSTNLVEVEHGRSVSARRIATVDLALDEALNDGKEVGGFTGVCGVEEWTRIANDGDLAKLDEATLDDEEVRGVNGVEGCFESGRVLVTGNGEVVEVARQEGSFVENAVYELSGEDLCSGVDADKGAAHGVGRAGSGGGGVGAVDGNLTGREVDSGEALMKGQVRAAVDVAGQVVAEAAGGEPQVNLVVDGEVHVGAVPVRPAGGQRRAAAECEVVLAAQVITERVADSFEEFAGAARNVEFGHQKGTVRSTRARKSSGVSQSITASATALISSGSDS